MFSVSVKLQLFTPLLCSLKRNDKTNSDSIPELNTFKTSFCIIFPNKSILEMPTLKSAQSPSSPLLNWNNVNFFKVPSVNQVHLAWG